MTGPSQISRRLFLKGSAVLGCSAAAHPLLNTVTFASAPGENRLVVIILRGAMDGLDVVQPYGDPSLRELRRSLSVGPAGGALDLDGFYALHPALAPLMPMWRAGELGFAHAVSTPYRDKRSHFDGQDMLEAGTGMDVAPSMVRDGWLNRLLQTMPDVRSQTAYSVGAEAMPVLAGSAPFLAWAPDTRLELGGQAEALFEALYHDDPRFSGPAAEALEISRAAGDAGAKADATAIARFAAQRLKEETRIASFSLNGWDTHRGQAGSIRRSLDQLATVLMTLKAESGPVWGRTTVLAMTEFGRMAAENGSGGTDHGTGGALIMAGGAVRGGRVYGQWPGLASGDLYAGRDLRPTADVRAYAGWAMRGLFGLQSSRIENEVFPGLDLGRDPGLFV
ncbi:DUF1501 domain-containing protein [Falsirhodobacter sp. alg1]|uniref:DUF1501 domain-containing protein n=1 Tax=Falsirhodobacter sp. alg1 TaxID=1472418 RepID=UPI0005EF5A72|nr:DUF1501 domain-containing protein [Falsirhodobacter sp. alg1]